MMSITNIIFALKGFNIPKAQKELNRRKQIDPIELRNSIVDYHLTNNEFYRKKVGDKVVTCFEDLPIITKKDLQIPLTELVSIGYKLSELYIANTSGSSGHPFFYIKNKESHALTHAIIKKIYAQHGLNVNAKQARFYGIPMSGLARYKELIKDRVCNRVRFPIFDLSDSTFRRYIEKFRKNSFVYVYGYTSAIVLFAKYMHKNGIQLKHVCPSLQYCIVTSEVCTEGDKIIIEKALGVKVINEYGCSEGGIIAFDDNDGIWRMVTDDAYFEVVDNDNNVLPLGEEGRLLITSLSNKAMPLIRYEVGDICTIDKDCKGLYLKNMSGRVSDYVRLPSGKVAGGLTFYYISKELLENHNVIKEFIVRQTALDTFVFDVVSFRDFSDEELAFLQKNIRKYLEPNLHVIINRVERIDRPSSGKLKHFYSQI